jgi:Ca2+-binding EF-hand superfamily protein
MHRLFQNLFPSGDTLPFINAIFRIFSNKHGDESLDFKEFLTAMNVTTLRSEEEKLQVSFRYL